MHAAHALQRNQDRTLTRIIARGKLCHSDCAVHWKDGQISGSRRMGTTSLLRIRRTRILSGQLLAAVADNGPPWPENNRRLPEE